jgi:hypothetical protein
MPDRAPDDCHAIGLFPNLYSSFALNEFQLSAKKGETELFNFKAKLGGPLSIYDKSNQLIGEVWNGYIVIGQLRLQLKQHFVRNTISFAFKGEKYYVANRVFPLAVIRASDEYAVAEYDDFVYYGNKAGLGDVLIRREAFKSELHLAVISLVVNAIYAQFWAARDPYSRTDQAFVAGMVGGAIGGVGF